MVIPAADQDHAGSQQNHAGRTARGSSAAWLGAVRRSILISRTASGRLWWDTLRLKIPLLGDALRKAETARFARAMGTLVANSVPLVQSIGIAARDPE